MSTRSRGRRRVATVRDRLVRRGDHWRSSSERRRRRTRRSPRPVPLCRTPRSRCTWTAIAANRKVGRAVVMVAVSDDSNDRRTSPRLGASVCFIRRSGDGVGQSLPFRRRRMVSGVSMSDARHQDRAADDQRGDRSQPDRCSRAEMLCNRTGDRTADAVAADEDHAEDAHDPTPHTRF